MAPGELPERQESVTLLGIQGEPMAEHRYRYDTEGARDLLRRRGFVGGTPDLAWKRRAVVDLLIDAAALITEYGGVTREVTNHHYNGVSFSKVWTFGVERAPDHEVWMGMSADVEIRAWLWTAGDDRQGTRSGFSALPTAGIGLTFDHARRTVLGAPFPRGAEEPFREFGDGGGRARRITALECLVDWILQRLG